MGRARQPVTKHDAPPPVADINVTPMVDVMLVMLIIFMVITPMLGPDGVKVELVRTNHAIAMQAAEKSDAIVIAINRDAKVFLNTTRMSAEDLPARVKDLLTNRVDKTVFVKSDVRARYERVIEVVDNLRAGGVDNVGLLTEQIQDKAGTRHAAAQSARPPSCESWPLKADG